jgi:hypothetical protein
MLDSAPERRRLDRAARQCHIYRMIDPAKLTLEEIEADLELSEAQAARGETVPLEPILRRLHEHADRLEAKAASAHRPRSVSRP